MQESATVFSKSRSLLVIAMATCTVLLLLVVTGFTLTVQQQDISLQEFERIVSNSRLVKHALNCVLEKGPCTKEAKELKRTLPGVIRTACGNCSLVEKQRFAALLLRINRDNTLKSYWNQVLKKYDPRQEHRQELNQLVVQYGKRN